MIRSLDGIRSLAALALVLLLFAVPYFGCALNPSEKDPGETIPIVPGELDRTTRTNLITKYLPTAYTQMDSIAYDEALDEAYIFELLPDDEDPSAPPEWWDRIEELRVAGNMFGARYNNHDQKVERITLSMTVKTDAVDNTNYPGKPPTEIWYKITAFVDLLVVVEDPSDIEGVVNYVVSSDQIFTVRPDPDADSLWVIYKQADQEPIN